MCSVREKTFLQQENQANREEKQRQIESVEWLLPEAPVCTAI